MVNRSLLSLVLAGSIASMASASMIGISNIGGGLVLNSGSLGAAAFGNSETSWSQSSLAAVHAQLAASGVSTNGRITFLAADTDHGLAFMALIDEQLVEGAFDLGHVHMDSVGNPGNLAYLNDGFGNVSVTSGSGGSRIASGDFAWNSEGGGAGFAWSNLADGNTSTFRFNLIGGLALGLANPSTFQFVTWTGSAWAEIVVPADQLTFSLTNDYGFAATVIPTPSILTMALAPMIGLSLIRRRAR